MNSKKSPIKNSYFLFKKPKNENSATIFSSQKIKPKKWVQKLAVLILIKPFYNLFFKLRIEKTDHIKPLSGPLLIIGNHKSFFDSLALASAIPLKADVHPVRTMGETKRFGPKILKIINRLGVIKLIYLIFSVFPAIRGEGLEKALAEPIEIIKNKGVVLLHPEGGLVPGNEIGQFKRGAPYLALKTNTKILPVVFKIEPSKKLRKKYRIKFGRPFYLPTELTTAEEGAEYMRKIIKDLYETLP